MKYTACCWRSGEIEIIPTSFCARPAGTIAFASGPRERLEAILSARARHSYHAENLLVPGVPEAADDDAALKALEAWVAWAFRDYPKVDRIRVVPADDAVRA